MVMLTHEAPRRLSPAQPGTPDEVSAFLTTDFVALAPDVRATVAIEGLRHVAVLGGAQTYLYVLDATERLLGILPFHRLVFAPPDALVCDLMITEPISVAPDSPVEEAGRLLRTHNLLALPVLTGDGRMAGVVTLESASEAVEDGLVDDYLRQAGTDAEAMASRSPIGIAAMRLPWLLGTMSLELGAGVVISRFSAVLSQVILLASFMPVISAVSGNVGLQSAAIVVRGLDSGHVRIRDWKRHLLRESGATLVMALVCGTALGAVGAIWSGHLPFGMVIGAALIIAMLTAGVMGTVVPMVSLMLGFDPATTAGPFETAFQDVVGFTVFLWLASLLESALT